MKQEILIPKMMYRLHITQHIHYSLTPLFLGTLFSSIAISFMLGMLYKIVLHSK